MREALAGQTATDGGQRDGARLHMSGGKKKQEALCESNQMRVRAPIGGTVVVAGLWVRTEAAANTTLPACPLRAGVKTKTLSPRLRAQAPPSPSFLS